jgi:hypothetical protein
MEVPSSSSEGIVNEPHKKDALRGVPRSVLDHVLYTIYALALALSISIWFIAIRAPLWIDETGTYWQINAGFSEIWPRHFVTLSSPEYAYILWFSTKLIGTTEIALRLPSILAMLGAVYLLYLAARELFERDTAIISVVVFCLHPVIVFASIDARPYAFGVLATNSAILILLRLRRNDSNWLAVMFGFVTACIVWFQFLFIDILPALLLCFFAIKNCDRKTLWRQFGFAFPAFTLTFLPVVPIMLHLFRTGQTHVGEPAPNLLDLLWTFAPGWLSIAFCGTLFVAFLVHAARQRRYSFNRFELSHLLFCASLALIPILILYGVSVGTSLHTFAPHRRADAIPGIALCWAFTLSRFRSRTLRVLFCVTLVTVTSFIEFSSPLAKLRNHTWKYALEFTEKNASPDDAPVMICSEFPEADFVPMPVDSAKNSKLFAPLSYYNLSVPVVPLPRTLNDEAMRVGSSFLRDAALKHERFLALAMFPSYKTLDWLTKDAAATHSVRELGVFDGVKVLEFEPRDRLAPKIDK